MAMRNYGRNTGAVQAKGGSSAQTQATNFRIGTHYNPGTQFKTTYNSITGRAAGQKGGRVNLEDIAAKRTSILLGHGNKHGFRTTN